MSANTMGSSYTQAALVAHVQANQPQLPAVPPPVTEKIPPSMAKFVDVEAEIPVTTVQLDGLVVMKIIKHSRETPGTAAGLLVGLDLDGTLEVSNCFGLPVSADNDEKIVKTSGGRYEATMLRALREAQYDDNVIGFYQSTTMGAFLRQSLISTQASHHETLRQGGIALIHDVSSTARGNASLRAFRLTKSFLSANKDGKFHVQSLIERQVTFSTILEEVPVTIRSSVLLSAFLSTLSSDSQSLQASLSTPALSPSMTSLLPSFAHMDGAPPTTLARTMDALLETLDAQRTEENNIAFHSRQIARERARADAYIQKRKEENAARVAQGLSPLPEEDVARLFKIPPEPGRLDSTLLLGQVDGYAKSLEAASAAATVKLFVAQS